MAKLRLKYVVAIRNDDRPDKRTRFYFRRRGMPAIPLLGAIGSDEFMRAYGGALASIGPPEAGADRTTPGTISALVVSYYRSAAWLDLPEDTRRNRRGIIERFREKHGGIASPPCAATISRRCCAT